MARPLRSWGITEWPKGAQLLCANGFVSRAGAWRHALPALLLGLAIVSPGDLRRCLSGGFE